ncbi:hypothetical protein LCGC14_3091350 [marine sediment metagenome]|uniref:Uncharacterized protein n=1 Tax=marine sediment metagenome TaxID=412755 RepID=A0A0F8WAX9_9ZZZZ
MTRGEFVVIARSTIGSATAENFSPDEEREFNRHFAACFASITMNGIVMPSNHVAIERMLNTYENETAPETI